VLSKLVEVKWLFPTALALCSSEIQVINSDGFAVVSVPAYK
jgi:hypothetical protein